MIREIIEIPPFSSPLMIPPLVPPLVRGVRVDQNSLNSHN
ncbi:hypothetical protein CWATWH8502_4568 [Crocosphaera watsonii WH 8502]|uniref:Uncharacterized protein n=1 Tax=Crocosphaera watsonii WH 8502 TaxID=423474 RepID=T2I9M1_CROWT|nr:hypothetical protein CWATWH8502_4568 [Crocosphaera watsonii WH 8502]